MTDKPEYLYHCTRLDYLDNILKEGLLAKHPEDREDKHKGVYLSTYQFNWMWNSTRMHKHKGCFIKVDVRGLRLIKDYHKDPRDTDMNSKCIGTDYICLEDIDPDRIVEVDIETSSNCFQQVYPEDVKALL